MILVDGGRLTSLTKLGNNEGGSTQNLAEAFGPVTHTSDVI